MVPMEDAMDATSATREDAFHAFEHAGWEAIPAENAARHGFPLPHFLQREAEWWQALLAELRGYVGD